MFKVLVYFEDLQDNRHAYHAGDIFPREGVKVTNKRIAELASSKNRRGVALIEEIPEEVVSLVKEEPLEEKADVNPSKKTKPKRSTKKTGE